jgi:precorrin-4/cobalt-precorrin-4 C11-methyltransferase
VPERESVRAFAKHKATMVLFLSTGLLEKTQQELIEGGYDPETPAAIVYKASWPDEKTVLCTVSSLADCAKQNGIRKTALIIVGDAVRQSGYARSELYNPAFATEFRPAKE